jgi:ribonucleoside-diphosphate reductase alpha chain
MIYRERKRLQDINFTPFQELIYKRTYSRYLDKDGRRERWPETVKRYFEYMAGYVPDEKKTEFDAISGSTYLLDVMPSMRALWTAGKALDREHICGYNCAALIIDNQRAFAEMLYILMCGGGVGFSVERQFVAKLPMVPKEIEHSESEIVFADSKLGWAEGFNRFVNGLYNGVCYQCNLTKIRSKGKRLKVFGGRASGPEPLRRLIEYTKFVFNNAAGRQLSSIECHDICCYIASIVVVGGVRRSASISLSNLSDDRMRTAKNGEFWRTNPQRTLANNAVCYTEKPEPDRFLEEWLNLMRSGSGERGIFNREGTKNFVKAKGRDHNHNFLVNPCGEVVLRPKQFCNLTEVVVRDHDTFESLKKKVQEATIMGCIQSTLTDFGFLSADWKKNCEEERLLGVSLTGLRDHKSMGRVCVTARLWLACLNEVAHTTAKEWAKALGVNAPAAICCVKPSGTVSLLVDSASGMHPRFSKYYIRRVRVACTDPLCSLLKDQGVSWRPENGETEEKHQTAVFEFPIKAPEGAITTEQVSAIGQLEYWKMLKTCWCDHNPSVTIYVGEGEWVSVGAWVYDNWDYVGGITFLPRDNQVYQLAPYEAISESEYERLAAEMPDIDYEALANYENEDQTEGSREFACSGNACELV